MADDQQLAGMQHSGGVGASDLLSLVASEERRRARARAAESAAEAALADLPSTQGGGEVAPPQSVAPTVVYVDREGRSRPQPRHIKFPRRDGASDAAGYRARLRRQAAEAEASAPLSSSQGRRRPTASPAIPPPATPKHLRFREAYAEGERRDG